MFDYKDDVLSFNNFVDRIYPIEPEIKDTTDTEALVHIIFFWWRIGPYTALRPSGPWTICYLLSWKSRSTCSTIFSIWILVKFWYWILTRKVIWFLVKQNIQWFVISQKILFLIASILVSRITSVLRKYRLLH
jgi:hypothetical protein